MKVILKNVQLKAVSSWLPTNKLEMTDLGTVYGETEVANIIKATGVERARIADKDMCSSDMCLYAAENLIEKEGIEKSEIDGLVFVSQTTDWILPATSYRRTGAGKIRSRTRHRFHITVYCGKSDGRCRGWIYLWTFSSCNVDINRCL